MITGNIAGSVHGILTRRIAFHPAVERIANILTFTLFTCLGAFVFIPLPFTPVPVTLQTFFVLLTGLKLKKQDAAASQMLYIVLGSIGIPMFAGIRSGLFSVTTGYFAGFIAAAWLVAFLYEKKKSFLYICGILLFADMVLLCCGSLWISLVMNLSFSSALKIGILPFIPGDLAKIIMLVWFISWNEKIKQI